MFATTAGYYTHFEINPDYKLPILLQNALLEAYNHRYSQLYEENADSDIAIEDVFTRVLDTLWYEDSSLNGHKRYVWIAYSLGLATQPTVESYFPDTVEPNVVLENVLGWLKGKTVDSSCMLSADFAQQLSVGSQAIDEAMDVFRNLQKITDPQLCQSALLEILDDCIEGYAIFPGSEGRRDLFNWFLLEVIPASWEFQTPTFIYDMQQPWPPKL
jgi:hypothetical protein